MKTSSVEKYFYLIKITLVSLSCYLYVHILAKIENWDKIKRNVIVMKYDPRTTNTTLLNELHELDERRISILRQINRSCEIFIPERHPIIEKGILKQGKLVSMADVVKKEGRLAEWTNIHYVEYIDPINDLKNILEQRTLDILRYDGEPYKRVTCLLSEDREILRLSGVQQKNL